jgi:hypothetical protein
MKTIKLQPWLHSDHSLHRVSEAFICYLALRRFSQLSTIDSQPNYWRPRRFTLSTALRSGVCL